MLPLKRHKAGKKTKSMNCLVKVYLLLSCCVEKKYMSIDDRV